ncbi:hypothetical protein VTN31DRAFT_3247 [Thermomyces dupontii]|uniref:uncharacterized protein n=1 Tax=Talaromyces thermophilus TaxID=28565 RepID=UPI0037434116
MAATSPASVAAAPWRALFLEHISKLDDPYMSVATVGRDADSGRPVPRVRTCGFRGFFGELPLHHLAERQLKEENQLNPRIYESEMLSFTTDVRMEKVEHFDASDGAVEVVFWVKAVMAQWRLRGKALVIGDEASKPAEQAARAEILKGLRRRRRGEITNNTSSQTGTEDADWSWEKEVTAYFANHSPIMRGSFKNPPPGRPISEKPGDANLRLGQLVPDLQDPIARKNFRVVVIRVHEVDRLDLSKPEDCRRWKFTCAPTGDDGRWEEVELWP